MKKTLKIACFLALVLLAPLRIGAQDIYFGLTSEGQNFWFLIPQMPVNIIDSFLSDGRGGFDYEWVSFKNGEGKMDVDQGNFFGFKAKDLFNHFGYGVTVGYRPDKSFFAISLNGGYNYRQFRIKSDANAGKYKINSWYAGLTLRIVPFVTLLEEEDWSPFFEIGTNYRQPFKCKSPYGKDCDQFGKGFSTVFALGVQFYGMSVKLQYEMFGYDYLNKDYTTSTGSEPFNDIDSKCHGLGILLGYQF